MDVHLQVYQDKHKALIDKWLNGWVHPTVKEVPKVGYIATIDDRYIGAAFIRMIEGNYALLDSLVTNPKASGQKRHHAIDALVNQLIKDARNAGFKQLVAMSLDQSIIKRASKHGFQKLPHTVLALDLRQESLQ